METIIFDIETTAIPDTGLKGLEKIHCIAYTVLGSGTVHNAATPEKIATATKKIATADRIVAHNAIGFDVPVLKKFFPEVEFTAEVFDTLIMGRALWNDIALKDHGRIAAGRMPKQLRGKHSLEAYGYRLGDYKGDFGKTEGCWDHYTEEMGEYCKQDVEVLVKLYTKIMGDNPSDMMIHLENRFAEIMFRQEQKGVHFDTGKCVELMVQLRERKESIREKLLKVFPPRFMPVNAGKVFTSKVNNRKRHVSKGAQFCKIKLEVFNPGSRPQVASRLMALGWEPTDFTPKGGVTISEDSMKYCPVPESKIIAEYLMLSRLLGQMSDGGKSWLKAVTPEGRIHGRVNSAGAISGRCKHSSPNLANIPSPKKPYGKECRALFTAPPGYVIVGCDASGLELRCLAHFLGRYDGLAYAKQVLKGDIHTANQKAGGMKDRNQAKKFIYMWLYGSGAANLALEMEAPVNQTVKICQRFLKKTPGLEQLKEAVMKAVKTRGCLKNLDGRKMRTRSDHSALNLLLQGAGALIMKKALIECDRMAAEAGLDYAFVLNVHDEWQAEVAEKDAEAFAKISEASFAIAEKYFNFRLTLEGEAKIGQNWSETH